ncbi:hypothetical protein NE237_026338 [Protea cynaroides]|uniref:Uncharacterized protein n=1 Tax=Protea cynaroides TaxID=273540 RepID=A0A9Q0H3K1_9MAGN|nr:hypothetical protein NE237_026338 [Protea cynaroides]
MPNRRRLPNFSKEKKTQTLDLNPKSLPPRQIPSTVELQFFGVRFSSSVSVTFANPTASAFFNVVSFFWWEKQGLLHSSDTLTVLQPSELLRQRSLLIFLC